MRNTHKHPKKLYPLSDSSSAATLHQKPQLDAPHVIFWLLGSILFFLFATQLAPIYLTDIKATKFGSDTYNTFFGVLGIITYLLEPMMMVIYNPPEEDGKSSKVRSFDEHGFWPGVVNRIIFSIFLLPMIALSFFRPIFRTIILAVSFSFLNLPGPESAPFVIIVCADILLYFINQVAPKWGLSPATIAVDLLNVREKPILLNIGTVFFTIYTAIVYSFWLSLGYHTSSGHIIGTAERVILLLFAWFFATLYLRMPFLPDEADILSYLKTIPKKVIMFHVIILLISFAAYMWRFLFQ